MKPIGITRHIFVERPARFNAKITRALTPTSVRIDMSEAPRPRTGIEG
jgi:hypothetical protein